MNFYKVLAERFGLSEKAVGLVEEAESRLGEFFLLADQIASINQLKVLSAMQRRRLGDAHFLFTSGYGYNDLGRDAIEKIYADVFCAEAALVRPQLISGTHAIAAALFGNLRPGDELISATGKPYETLEKVIGIKSAGGSLAEHGVAYRQIELTKQGEIDVGSLREAINSKTKMVMFQRSKGYAWRRSIPAAEIGAAALEIKKINPDAICFADNCYGEFVEWDEPTETGADLIAGSLIKNPGGGLACCGGYVAGKAALVEAAAERMSAPGLGIETGPMLGFTRMIAQGLFFAPQVVAASLKCAALSARAFESLGFETLPRSDEARADIVQAIKFSCRESVLAFCKGIQRAAPVDSFATPEPAQMPGYGCDIVMASGSFTQGSSIELSADAPMKEPFVAYQQGGLTWPHARAGVAFAVDSVMKAMGADA